MGKAVLIRDNNDSKPLEFPGDFADCVAQIYHDTNKTKVVVNPVFKSWFEFMSQKKSVK